MPYDAFMSYSHAADGKLAPALQSALHAFARPWYRLRALHVFRDETTLALTPALWSTIASALDQSRYFILMASPEAAASMWVQREITYWLERNSPDRFLIVLTDGTLEWDRASGAFRPDRTTALPESLMRRFAEEPLYLDLRWARAEVHLSLGQPRFLDGVAELAAPLHGRAKDELVGEDIRQHRRAMTLAWSAVAALALLTLSSVIAAYVAVHQRDIAVEQSRIALSRQLAAQSAAVLAQSPDQLSLAMLLAVESVKLHNSFEGNQVVRAGLTLVPQTAQSYTVDKPPQDAWVRALAFSADGSALAVAREEGTAELFDLRGRQRRTLIPDQNPSQVVRLDAEDGAGGEDEDHREMTSVAFSADGKFVATGSNDHTARLWETGTGKEVLRVVHAAGVSTVAFSPTGHMLATGTKSGSLSILAIDTRRQVIGLKRATEVRQVAFSPDSRWVAAISTGGGISVSDLARGGEPRVWDSEDADAGLALTFSRDGRRLASANGTFAFVRDVNTGKILMKVTHASSRGQIGVPLLWLDAVALSSRGQYLATGGRDGTARVWNLDTGQELIRLRHGAPVGSVAFSPDDTLLSAADAKGVVHVWEIPSGKEKLRSVHPESQYAVAEFSPDGSRLATAGADGAVHLWGLTRGDERARMAHPVGVRLVAFSPDGTAIATADQKGGVRLWSPEGRIQAEWGKSAFNPKRLMFGEDGRYLIVDAQSPSLAVLDARERLAPRLLLDSREIDSKALGRRYVAAWSRASGQLRLLETRHVRELPAVQQDGLFQIALDSSGSFLAGRHDRERSDSLLQVWALPELRTPVLALQVEQGSDFWLSPGGRYLAVEGYDRGDSRQIRGLYVDIWDVRSGARVARIPRRSDVAGITYAPDASAIYVHVQGEPLQAWELPGGKLKARFSHQQDFNAVRVSDDGSLVATLSEGRVYLWDSATGEPVSQLLDVGYVRDVRFSPDGRHLLIASDDGTASLWLWKTGDLKDEACKRLPRNLSEEEWRRYMGALPYHATCPNLPPGR